MTKNITVYSTPTCPYCIKTKQFLKDKGVEFNDIDVNANQEKAQEMINRSGQMSVPVIVIGEKIITGFDKVRIESLIGA